MSKKVIITGGSGFIGTALTWVLLQRGYDVVSLDINPPRTDRAMFVEADLIDGIPEHHFLEKPTYIINLAGAPIYGRWSTEYKELLYHSRVEGTKNLVEFMRNPKYRPEAFVSASATGFYGDAGTINVDERSDPGAGFLAQLCIDWEDAARQAEKLGVRTTIIRNGHVIGVGGLIRALAAFYRFKLLPQTAPGHACMPWIHQDDLVNLYVQSMEEPHAPNVINAVAPHITTNGEFYRELSNQTGAKIISIPPAISRLFFRDLIDESAYGQCVKSEAISSRYDFKYPTIKRALKEVLGR